MFESNCSYYSRNYSSIRSGPKRYCVKRQQYVRLCYIGVMGGAYTKTYKMLFIYEMCEYVGFGINLYFSHNGLFFQSL